jgi:large subunit ribosomal protein L9
MLAARKEKIEKQRAAELDAAKALAAKVAETEISIPMQASEDDQLFGSVTARSIAEKLAENGIEVDVQRIKLEEHIKTLGSYEVEVKLHADVAAVVKVWVVRA